MFKKIGIGFLAVVALFFGYIALVSPEYEISREITINAPAEKIFPYLSNSKLAEQWGPWLETDPQAKMNYSGPAEGVGAVSSWDSPGQLGTGSATITESELNQRVGIQLEYSKPMVMKQFSEYLIQPSGNQSVVTWRVRGQNTCIGRVMCTFGAMDKIVGGMFEKGLSNLKTLVEKSN